MINNSSQYIAALEKGETEKARRIFEGKLKTGSVEDIYNLAEELQSLGFLEEAIEAYQKLLEYYPNEGELKIALAEIYINLDQEDEALAVLENIDVNDSFYPEALILQADLYQLQGLFEVSEQKLLQAEKLLPDEPIIQFALGELYSSIGRFAEAIYKYEQVLAKTHEVAGTKIHQRLAESYSAGGDFEKALEYYEIALDDKLDINLLYGFGITAYQAGYYNTAIQKLSEVLELDSEFESAYLPLSHCYEHEEDLDKALEVAVDGIKVSPFNKEILNLAGKISMKLGKVEEAEKHFRAALHIDINYLEALLMLNKLLLQQERYEELIQLIEPSLNDGEDDPEVLWDFAVACEKEERYSDALNSYRKAYIYFKEKEEFLQNFGFFLLEEGIFDESIEVFKQLQKIDPTNVDYIDVLERLQTIENEV